MTIPFTTSGNTIGLFNRIGQIGQVVADIQALVGNGNTLPTDVTTLLNLFEGTSLTNQEADLVSTVPTLASTAKLAITVLDQSLAQVAGQTVARMVFRDNPINSRTNTIQNLQELIRQMQAAGASVKSCTITGSASPFSSYTNVGNGIVVISTKRGDGLTQENTFAETARLTCTGDAQGGGVAGNETFQFLGTEAQTNPFHYEWPLGSGASTTLQSTDATGSNTRGNLLTNSAFSTQSSNLPANWADPLSLAGIDFFTETVQVYGSDPKAMKFIGGTGHTPNLTQQFNISTGTAGALKPDTVYHFNIAMKVSSVPPSGSIMFELIDQSNLVVSDDQGVANQLTVSLNSLSPTYAFTSVIFRTPKTLPVSTRLRYRIGNSIPTGYNLFLAHSSLAVATKLYTGGPFMSIHSGSSNWIKGDKFTVTFTNDRGGSVMQKTFQTLFDRLFSMRLNELLLPSATSPTIADTLI